MREALNRDDTRVEAADAVRTLIETVTIYPRAGIGGKAEVAASPSVLLAFAAS